MRKAGDNYQTVLGKRIRECRTTAGLSRHALATMLGSNANMVSKWENGYTVARVDNLVQLSEIFNVSLDYLVGHEMKKNNSLKEQNIALRARVKELTDDILRYQSSTRKHIQNLVDQNNRINDKYGTRKYRYKEK